MGHNAYVLFFSTASTSYLIETFHRFLRWSAIQDAAFIDSESKDEKFWSESNVSEDFDMALRLLMKGYIFRYGVTGLK